MKAPDVHSNAISYTYRIYIHSYIYNQELAGVCVCFTNNFRIKWGAPRKNSEFPHDAAPLNGQANVLHFVCRCYFSQHFVLCLWVQMRGFFVAYFYLFFYLFFSYFFGCVLCAEQLFRQHLAKFLGFTCVTTGIWLGREKLSLSPSLPSIS